MDENKRLEEIASIGESISWGARILSQAGVPEARREASSILAHVLKSGRTHLISHSDEFIDHEKLEKFKEYLQRRAAGEPLQYITGIQDFFGLEFIVTPAVLIPRPETELLVQVALDLLDREQHGSSMVCDVGTGSGCIVISLLKALPNTRAMAIDISAAAIEVADINAVRHQVRARVSFAVSDCFSALNNSTPPFDMIVSNPPYVAAASMPGLQREVRDHEPRVALSPGGDGLSVIRRLLEQSPRYLKAQGHLLFEIGFDQGEAVRELIRGDVWEVLDIHPDLQGIPRIVALQKRAA
ncbi:MAG TPA: peptide chain release factor N(5)-glutamine methyltransferase [Pyrinomonadaceae bacterium]|nr:peptide chain release factor N(5)-glutamine methyltransferase [Pyrinomonadaceae bacterium]